MKLITKLKKAPAEKKTKIWQDADMARWEAEELVKEMILALPPGHYKLRDREYGANLVDKIWEEYGWMPSMFVSERILLGLQTLYPKKVAVSFTLGLDAVEVKK